MTKAGSTEKVVREIRRHTRRRPALDDPTVVQYRDAIGDRQRILSIARRIDHRPVLGASHGGHADRAHTRNERCFRHQVLVKRA